MLERFQDGPVVQAIAVAQHPLNLADPHRQPGQFGGVGIDFDAEHGFRPDRRKTSLQAQRLRFQHDLMFDVLQRPQRQVQKVARAAGRVQHPERPQPFQKPMQPISGLLAGFGRRLAQPGGEVGFHRRPLDQ